MKDRLDVSEQGIFDAMKSGICHMYVIIFIFDSDDYNNSQSRLQVNRCGQFFVALNVMKNTVIFRLVQSNSSDTKKRSCGANERRGCHDDKPLAAPRRIVER